VTKIVKSGKLSGFWNDEGVNDEGGSEESHNEIPFLSFKNIVYFWLKTDNGLMNKKYFLLLMVFYGFHGYTCSGFYKSAHQP